MDTLAGWDLEGIADEILGLAEKQQGAGKRGGPYRTIARRRGYYRDADITQAQNREWPASPVLGNLGRDEAGKLFWDPARRNPLLQAAVCA